MARRGAAADPCCSFRDKCVCSWVRRCSPRIPSVAPGRDYSCAPAGGDDPGAWSVLVGFISASPAYTGLFSLHRFHVARSGRVLGRSDDTLEVLRGGDDRAKAGEREPPQILSAMATPSPDGRSLFLFSRQIVDADDDSFRVRACPLQLHYPGLDADNRKITASPLPAMPLGPIMRTRPISAAGDLWAPCLSDNVRPPLSSELTLKRLDKDAGRWVEVDAKNQPHVTRPPAGECIGRVLHGYAVIGDVILLSLQPSHIFFTFDCSTCTWAEVATTKARNNSYIPIHERAVYVEEDDAIYFLSGSVVYAYKLCQDDQGQYRMDPPTLVDCVCPFDEEGYGFLTHLRDRLMCAVWIGVSLRCSCDTRHVLITVFRVVSDRMGKQKHFFPKGIKILHSTCRRLDVLRSMPNASHGEFCFLQEYEEFNLDTSMLLEGMEAATSFNVAELSVMLGCCREFRNETPLRTAVMLEGSPILATKALYIVCQVASHSTVYKVFIVDGRLESHGQILIPYAIMDTFSSRDEYGMMEKPLPWHFIRCSKTMYAVPRSRDEIHMCDFNSGALSCIPMKRPVQVSIALVLQVGHKIIAISDTLQGVYHLSCTYEWTYRSTYGSLHLKRKLNLSGYVVLSDDSFMVYDSCTSCLFLLDLRVDKWIVVVPFTEVTKSLPHQTELLPCSLSGSGLCGRSAFVDGFIYTCTDGGLAAYEIIQQEGSHYIGDWIYLQFPWHKYWESDKMCLDYVGKDCVSGSNMFCVVQGGNFDHQGGSPCHHSVCITTIEIKTERTSMAKFKPVAINHVDIATSTVEQSEGVIWTSSCFAVAL